MPLLYLLARLLSKSITEENVVNIALNSASDLVKAVRSGVTFILSPAYGSQHLKAVCECDYQAQMGVDDVLMAAHQG